MIERAPEGHYVLTCDYCEDDVEEYFDSFMDAVHFKKDNEWKSVKTRNGAWKELCPECAGDAAILEVVREGE